MSSWNPQGYLRFERERTLPCRDLVNRIELNPSRIVDLGCGPGNSTAVLVERWPSAKITGVDSSPEMLQTARTSSLGVEWELADIREWTPAERFDLAFSNAAFQWIPDHERLLVRLFGTVEDGGALAFQIPTHTDLWFEVLDRLVKSSSWKDQFQESPSDFFSHGLDFYYDLFSPRSKRVELWETEYIHVLSGPEGIIEWTRGTALRPILQRLPDDHARSAFVSDYTNEISSTYTKKPDGKVLFPFLRRFVVAYR
jgi:trans-aconitate 2-methyltransferase